MGLRSLSRLTYQVCLKKIPPSLAVTVQTNFCPKCGIFTPPVKRAKALYDPENKGERQDGVNFDTIGSWNNRLNLPLNEKQSARRGEPIPQISIDDIGYATVIGRRTENQDRFKVSELTPDILYFAIFDGHGTAEAADFVHSRLEDHIKYWLQRTKDLQMVLKRSFVDVDNMFNRFTYSKQKQKDWIKAEPSNSEEVTLAYTGTTATVCLLRNGVELVIGHVGDTCAILCRQSKAIRLTADHEPEMASERERIESSGGSVIWDSLGRPLVNGILAMSRSIGDQDLKPFGVSAVPDTRSVGVRHSKDSFLVLITDGISFVMNDQEITDTISNCKNPMEGAKVITDQALQFGSQDNSTCVVIPFGAWGKFAGMKGNMPFSFSRIPNRSH
ncbi:protein phosphatase 1K, mitochondrial-like [Lingula anatina]|uniref:Protein phosphatase 1K, mitochondrial-like n=1 Tax=Lingula anatina TaxID=7574 RepID=A0A1S3IW13_LINAN|nr:protein phosphatase 1K, mitochondrial-like [Lingula anatina]XP_013415240.1 protein phosphatase 1K, mitochondrial-like [Lingula anatina]|eukprot:XP_013415239.1 protein phosphatase 1K, mitochondrial-like [Lingula anatina]